MLLTADQFREYADAVSKLEKGGLGIDFETTNLSVYRGAKAFLLGCSHATLGEVSIWLLDHLDIQTDLKLLCGNPKLLYCGHNIKFEISFLRQQFGTEILGKLWDTEVMARVAFSNHLSYSLQKCAEREGWTKYKPMLEWLKKNKNQYFKAPLELIVPYVEQDAKLSRLLCGRQLSLFKSWNMESVPIHPVVRLEMMTTACLSLMEHRGMNVDLDYCRRALAHEQTKQAEYKRQFHSLTGAELVDSRKSLEPIFRSRSLTFGQTEKGNASFTEEILRPQRGDPVVSAVLGHRDSIKRASSYWENFISLSGDDGRIHPNIRQTAAKTSRMSVTDPACQTWPDDPDDEPFPIRRAFPADPGCLIVSMDWSQMELCKASDEAEDDIMIEAIKSGRDLHQETADIAGVKRSVAKNGRFAKLYGAGPQRIADTLGVSLEDAKRVVKAIEDMSPKTTAWSRRIIHECEISGGKGRNWLGRRYNVDRGFEYKMPNYVVQGACGEILRIAITRIAPYLQEHARPETRMVLPIHDEIVYNWHPDDFHLIPVVQKIMEEADISAKQLRAKVSVTYGPNFFDLEPFPT